MAPENWRQNAINSRIRGARIDLEQILRAGRQRFAPGAGAVRTILRRFPELPALGKAVDDDLMGTFLYRCPVTGYRVQGFVASDPTELKDDAIEPVTCTVCARVHLVNPKTGQTLRSKE